MRKILLVLFPDLASTADTNLPARPQFFQGVIFLLAYQDQHVQTNIKANKYHRSRTAASNLARALDTYLANLDQPITLVPMPQSEVRWRERGFDHLQEITARCVTKTRIERALLKKHIHTKRQAHVSKSERLTQQAGTFICNKSLAQQMTGTIVLFDDVITTGATMQAARAALAPHLPVDTRLLCLALAH